ncbi:uncharacterized protein LOC125505843 [Dendroctonus ponderosae]|uniref:uncharacterized protein LOC125505843 n=1 Tax=Dendroctonus ponderosae TaxID=77166 RepID=UPI0020366508|nr:uncharacterized protein LOC125505843 [Dendroctonus ponderosae]
MALAATRCAAFQVGTHDRNCLRLNYIKGVICVKPPVAVVHRFAVARRFQHTTKGCETWTVKLGKLRKLDAFEMWIYRRMLRIPWTTNTTNAAVLTKMNTRHPQLTSIMKIRKTAYLGHLMRHEESEQLEVVLEGKIEGKRGMGRKKKS